MKETVLYVARHGETLWNKEKRMQGHKGVGLSPKGYEQSEELAINILKHKYPITVVYSSHLERAKQTAEVVADALGIEVKIEPGIAERNFGEFEGKTFDELEKRFAQSGMLWWETTPPGGESLVDFNRRSIEAIDRIVDNNRGSHVLVLSHGGTIRRINEHFNSQNPALKNVGFDIQNASLWIHKV